MFKYLTAIPSMTGSQKNKLVEAAKSFIGKPYKYGARPEEAPEYFDCSLFVQYIFGQINIELPRSGILQAADHKGKEIKPASDFSNLDTGDLLFIRSNRGHYRDELFGGKRVDIGHVVIYLGDDEIINARQKEGGVVVENLRKFIRDPNCKIILVKRF